MNDNTKRSSRFREDYAVKIDNEATNGLTGTEASLAYQIHELIKHHHSRARWFGISGDQSGDNWAANTLTPFVAISGNNAYGSDADDEAKVLGTDDTPAISGMIKFDFHEILVVDVDDDTPYKLRIINGTGTMSEAISAGQFSEAVVQFDSANPQLSAGVPITLQTLRFDCNVDKVWIQAWNATNNSQIDFLVGMHEYEG